MGGPLDDAWVRILFGARSFPPAWGLFVTVAPSTADAPDSSGVHALCAADGRTQGVSVRFDGYELQLLLTEPKGLARDGSVHRPRLIRVMAGTVERTIYLHWDQPSSGECVVGTWPRGE